MKLLLVTTLPVFASPAFAADLYAFGYSPKGWPAEESGDQTAFFQFLGDNLDGKGALLVGASWRDDTFGASTCGGSAPSTFTSRQTSSVTYGFTPIYIAEWRSGNTLLMNCPSPESTTNSWLNTDSTGHYKSMLVVS